jgi:type I restriction enzyme M protein
MTLDEYVGSTSVRYIPPGKIVDYLTGKLRRDTPEEHVRQRIVRSLVEEYSYRKEQFALDFRIHVFSKSYPADIVIFREGQAHRQENIYIIVETKNETIKPLSKQDGIGQLTDYVGAAINCEFGMWTNGVDKHCYQKKKTPDGQFAISEIVDIPPRGKSIDEYEELDFKQLRPATELETVFRRCHDYIYGNQGLPKDTSFHELLKVIFCKVHDENESTRIRFYVSSRELKSPTGQLEVKKRIDELFKEVKDRYPHIFKKKENETEKIELYHNVLAYIVGQLQHFSLLLTDTDVKGKAYEEIVGANLRGDRGEFFTPRNVCKMAIESLFAMYPRDKWASLRLIDPACGTGGFLVEIINFIKRYFVEEEKKKWGEENEVQALKQAEIRLRKYCEQNVYGIDINPLLVRASQMNEVMHGNGSGNLFPENSLTPVGEWKNETKRDALENFDLLLTNPPFGSKIPIDDPHTLEQYDLGYIWHQKNGSFERTDRLQRSVPPEQLFVERCIQLLKPKGKLAIVLPDSILSNPGLAYIRFWILKKAKIIASIDLPKEAFPRVGTKTSVLFLEKKAREDILVEERSNVASVYDVFMAIAEKVGKDKRNNTIYRRTPEGEIIVVEKEKEVLGIVGKEKQKVKIKSRVSEPIEDDDLVPITVSFKEWINRRLLST